MRRWGWLGLSLLAWGLLAGSAWAQTTTTTSTTTTTVVIAPVGDGRFVVTSTDKTLPNTAGQLIVYVNTVAGDVTLTLPPVSCGCEVVPIKLTADHWLHIQVADVGTEGITIDLGTRLTTLDYDKSLVSGQPQLRFVANPLSHTWFPSF